jgi:hypothetical protein
MCWRAAIQLASTSYATQLAQQEKSKVAYLHLRDLCVCIEIFPQSSSIIILAAIAKQLAA